MARIKEIGVKDGIKQTSAALNRQLDLLVYELYTLTPDELALVEDSVPR